MNKNLVYCLLSSFFILFLGSCRDLDKNTLNASVIRVPVRKIKSEVFADLFSEVRYVPLETTKKSLITKVDKLIVGESIIVVWDKRNYSILLFNKDGGFISKLGDQGRGPREYVDILDITIDEKNKQVILNDPGKQSLFYFDFEGKFLEYKSLIDFSLTGPALVDFKDYIIFNRGYYPIDGNYLGVFDKNTLKFKESILPFKITSLFGGRDFLYSFQKHDSELLFLAPFTNEVFKIESNLKVTKLFDLFFDIGNPDYDDINQKRFKNIMEFDNYIKSAGYILDVNNFLAYDDYIYFTFLNNSGMQNVFYKRGSEKIKVVNGVKGDLDRYVWSQIMTSKGKELIGVIDNPEDVFNLKITHKMPINEMESNPVLAFYLMNDTSFK